MFGVARTVMLTLTLLAGVGLEHAKAQDSGQVLTGPDAFGGWEQDKPGVGRQFTVEDMPQPTASETQNFGTIVPIPDGARPLVPDGFTVEPIALNLKGPRAIRVAPNGDLFIAESMSDDVKVLRVGEDGKTAQPEVFANGLNKPYGIAFYPAGADPKWIYIANSDSVIRYPYQSGDIRAKGEPEVIVPRILWTHHYTRDITFTPDGKTLLLTVGSGSNVALDMFPVSFMGGIDAVNKNLPLGATWDTEEGRAMVLAYDPDGKNQQVYATGLRNCSGIAIQPATGSPWCVVNERDGLGDDVPFEYATAMQQGTTYGWPWYYIGGHEDPRHAGERPDLKDKVTIPDVLMQAHSAPLQIAFYEGEMFPAEYKGSAFVTMHGSWNRGKRTGYKVVRLLFDEAGKPTGAYEDFMTGMVVSDTDVWGRPVGVAVGRDGSLFVSEDGNGSIWRIAYGESAK
ncbi:PQQ-dependent sugar dehydrogenase [Devosia sp. ZB163]|uniref:PQQ-dependent sugar dehydrogenase n=1 Tax=Devosia sp. ZB163 TaxID=3025938 RepID=UPI0023627B66|nr:PQQ-dependent sugar dehydrogenase [Devosia sp. ZB163]MDC9825174.1 PQQ-dependent sugar dehydrogenase [Devosia sp. ZB163]